jgi:hypothetical protein
VEAPEAETGSGTLSFLCQTRIDLTPPPPAYGAPDPSDDAQRVSESSASSDHSYPPSSLYAHRVPNPNATVTPASGSLPKNGPPPFGRATSAISVPSSSDSTAALIPINSSESISDEDVASDLSYPIPRATADPQVRSEVTRFFVRTVPRHSNKATNRLSFLPTTLLGAPHKVSMLMATR